VLQTAEQTAGFHGDLPAEWHALYTRHQHEKIVTQILSAKGFEVFLPVYTAARRSKDRTTAVHLPLFPCYVFLRGGLERRVDVMTTPGIHSFVESCGRPAIIPSAEITAIQTALRADLDVEPCPFLRCGDWVRVKSGALAGLEGILTQKKNLFRLVLSVEMLGKSVSVEVDSVAVERTGMPLRAMAVHA
jgi:transcription antitermination factor NusG